jgi:hypothetical protein
MLTKSGIVLSSGKKEGRGQKTYWPPLAEPALDLEHVRRAYCLQQQKTVLMMEALSTCEAAVNY